MLNVKVDDREFRDKVISHSKVLASGDVRFTSELGRCETTLNGMDRAEMNVKFYFMQGFYFWKRWDWKMKLH